MSILIRRIDERGTFQLVNGHARLRTSLKVFGRATVTDVETHESFEVHEVDGLIVAIADGRTAVAEAIAVAAIEHAARK